MDTTFTEHLEQEYGKIGTPVRDKYEQEFEAFKLRHRNIGLTMPEGSNKETICWLMRIDSKDLFGLLLAAAGYDAIGAVTVRIVEESDE